MRINEDSIDKFIELQDNLLKIIDEYEIHITSLCKFIRMSPSTFYRKEKAKDFRGDEMRRIAKYINR